MKNFSINDWLWIFLSTTLIIFALTTIIWGIEPTWCWLGRNAGNIATWVQAIGVFVALYAAINAPRWNREHTSKHFEKMLFVYLGTALEVTEYVSQKLNTGVSDIEIHHLRDLHASGVKPLIEFPVMELDSHEMAREVIIISAFCLTAHGALNKDDAFVKGAGAMNQLIINFRNTLKEFWKDDGQPIIRRASE